MRFFQPMSQQGFARILVETRTHYPLAPGLIAIERSDDRSNISAHLDMKFPPKHDGEIKDLSLIKWVFPDKIQDRVLTKHFSLSIQPFYPAFVSPKISEKDYEDYVYEFLSLSDIKNEVFTLPLSFVDYPLLDSILETECSLFILEGFHSILSNQNRFTEVMVRLKERLSPDIALYLPGPIPPSYYSFLVYSGIDFFDTSIAYYISQRGYFLTENSIYPISKHPHCFCPYCSETPPNILMHNLMVLQNKIASIRYALKENVFRRAVEKEIHNFVPFAAALKHFDSKFGRNFQKRFPLRINAPLKCIGEESLYNPAIVEYRERIKERYTPDPNSRIVLIIPCSAKKPYSFSKSHKLFGQAIKEGMKNNRILSELIVTSPLGVVPRELESIYPARFYDIPVVGKWSEEEINISADLLVNVLQNYPKNTVVINHTNGKGYKEIMEYVKNYTELEIIDTALTSSPTSHDSLTMLTNTLRELDEQIKTTGFSTSMIKMLKAVADFQFGKGAGEILFNSKIKIKGRYPRNREIYTNNKHVATLTTSDGFLSLSPRYAQKIVEIAKVNVEFTAERVTGSSIYAPGCEKADENILPKDEIFLVNEGKVVGTAMALVSGTDMNKMRSGMIATIKKKRKDNEN